MSKTVDERIVEMRFDNKHFESNVQTSLSTLDKLKQSLKLTDAVKGLENVDLAAKKFDISPLSNGVEVVRTQFSALEVMAVTALANITNSAVNAGKKIVSALTIDPIKTGFSEYETQINAVQTILANTQSKGTTLDDVNGALDTLNKYADKTIYNFTEMTRNIGTFTAAGVDLDTSVSAIQGIANLAAVSGSTSQQASTAMYQLSQALASGTVKLQDWNSVVNAGMGGQVFQDALKRTAKVMGTDVDALIKKYGSFRESLSKGEWLTTDVLTATLEQFTMAAEEGSAEWENFKKSLMDDGYTEAQAEEILKMANTATDAATKVKTFTQLWDTLKEAAQSGWTQSWEIIVGDFEEAKSLLTGVSDVIGEMINKSAEARNKVLEGWAKLGGRTAVIDGIKNTFAGLLDIIGPIKEAFRDVFPTKWISVLIDISRGFRNVTASFKEFAAANSDKIYSTFKGIFSVIDIGITVLKQFAGGVIKLISNFTGLGGGILNITGSIGEWLSSLRDGIKEADVFGRAIDTIVGFLQNGIDKIKEFAGFVKEKIAAPGFEGFLNIMRSIGDVMQKIGGKIIEIGGELGSALGDVFRSGDIAAGLDILNGGLFAGILLGIKKYITGITDAFDDSSIGILDKIKDTFGNLSGIFDSVRESLQSWQQNLKANVLLKIAGAIAILAAAIVVISMIKPEKLSASIGAITMLFANLMGAMAIFDKFGGSHKMVMRSAIVMVAMATAVLILAAAMKTISDLDVDQLGTGITGIAVLSAIMVGVAKLMSDKKPDKIMKGATSLIIFAAAIKILATVCKDLSAMKLDEMGKGLLGVGVLMAAVSAFLNYTKFNGKAISTATGVVILAAALKILANVCSDFGEMDQTQLRQALAAIAVLLIELAAFTKLTANANKVISTATSLVIIGAAMKIFASAMIDFASMNMEDIGRGLMAMGGALGIVAAALIYLPKNMLSLSAGLVIVSAALVIIANVMRSLGNMSCEEIGRSIVALASSIGILAMGLSSMSSSIAGAAALIIAAGALAILTPILTTLGGMSWIEIAKGLVTIAGAFTIIGIAGYLLTPVVPTILAAAKAFLLIGIATLGVGVGLAAAAAGLTALAAAGTAGAAAIVTSLTIIITGIIGLIPTIAQKIGEAIVMFCKVIGASATVIAKAITEVIFAVVDLLVDCVPKLADGLLKLLVGVMEALATYTPQIVELLFDFLIGIIDATAAKLPDLIKSAVNLLMAFFSGIVDALSGIDVGTLIKGIAGIGLLAGIMMALSAVAGLVPGAMIGILGMGMVLAELALVLAAVGAFAQIPGLQWLIDEGGSFLESVGSAIGGFVGGIVGGFMGGVSSSFPKIGTDLANFMTNVQPFIDGAKSIDAAAMTGVETLVGVISTLTKESIRNSLTSWFTGGSSLTDFAEDLIPFGEAMNSYSQKIAGIDAELVTNSALAGKALAEMASAIPNTGGLVAFFTGENDMATFGANLISFGTNFKAYSEAMTGVDTGIIMATTSAATAIVALAKSLPEDGGWFSDDQTLADFGKDLAAFGKKFAEYYGNISGIDAAQMAGVASEIRRLKNLMTGMVGFDGSGVNAFVTGLATLGTVSVDGLVSAFAEAGPRISVAVTGMVTVFINAVVGNTPRVTSAFAVLMAASIAVLTNHQQVFHSAGSALMMWLATGFINGQARIVMAITLVVSTCLTAISGYYTSFYSAGGYLVEGFAAGITDNTFKAEASAAAMADAAYDAAMEAMDANSPARRFITAGGYATEGFAIGIDRLGYMVKESATNMADTAVKAASHVVSRVGNVVTSGINAQPSIRPVVDMSHLRVEDIKLTSSLNTVITKPVDSMARIMTDAQSDINASNRKVVAAINELREDLNALYNSDDQEIALYVDSKKLATSIAKPMNRQLNILSKRGAY